MTAIIVMLGIASDSGAATPAFQSAVAGDAPVLHYQFNEATGAAVNHGSLGAAFDGTYFGTPVRSSPTAGGDAGIHFATVDDYIVSLDSSPAGITGNPTLTIEAIVLVPAGAIAQLWPPFLHWGTGSPQTGRSVWLSLQNNNNNIVYAGFYNTGLRTQFPISLGHWHHIVWVRDGAAHHSQEGTILYVNGFATSLLPDTDLLGPLVPDVTSTRFRINRGHDFTRYFQGTLDELVLYDRVLSESEVEAHFTASALLTGVEPGTHASRPGLHLSAGPNPFSSATEVRFRIPEAGPALLTIYDTAGRRVVTLAGGHREAGEFAARWDGRNEAGFRVAPGIYFVRLEAAHRFARQAIVLLR